MSQVNNLMNSLSDTDIALYTVDPSSEPHIIIGEDRIVVVPEELKKIAVQHDNDIETVTFDCPRYWDEHDMSKMAVYINYLPNKGEVGQDIGKNVRVDESNPNIMHFDWTISGNATVNEGRLIFLVDVKGKAGEHWHSEICQDTYVSEGLEAPPFIEIGNPDVLTRVLLFHSDVIELNALTLSRAAVYVGSGEMPEGYNVQVDPEGESDFESVISDATNRYIQQNGNELIEEFSAYASAKRAGFEGTEEEWVASLKGAKGDTGATGKGLDIRGTFDTLELLNAGVTNPEQGHMYNVGTSDPYTIYMYDTVKGWVSQGQLQGAKGTTFTPSIAANGDLSWSNDGGLANPETVNIKGEKGDAFTYDDFTPEQLAALKGEKGDAFTYDDFTPEQLAALKGEKGDTGTYSDFTEAEKTELINAVKASLTTETWTFTLEDGSTVDKEVYVK